MSTTTTTTTRDRRDRYGPMEWAQSAGIQELHNAVAANLSTSHTLIVRPSTLLTYLLAYITMFQTTVYSADQPSMCGRVSVAGLGGR